MSGIHHAIRSETSISPPQSSFGIYNINSSSSASLLKPQSSAAATSQYLGTGVMPLTTRLANAAYVARELVSAVCVTHAHLDHLSGLIINSSCFTVDNPKVLAGLPWVIDNLLKHVFNNVIWPNMTSEGEEPIGLITLRRLECTLPTSPCETEVEDQAAYLERDEAGDPKRDRISPVDNTFEDEENYEPIANGLEIRAFPVSHGCVHHLGRAPKAFESSAFFIRDVASGKEVLMFGDVEPDSISIDPRNRPVWVAAARKFGRNKLTAIFIECSYASVQPEHSLFGHLSPSFLIQELKMFASLLRCDMPGSQNVEMDVDDEASDIGRRMSSGTTATGSSRPSPGQGDSSFDEFSFDQSDATSAPVGIAGGSASPFTSAPAMQFTSDKQKLASSAFVPFSFQQQQQQQQLNHPYSLHPHPHYHHHSRHKAMQQYSPTSSRRTSTVSLSSSVGSGGSLHSAMSTSFLPGLSEPSSDLDAPVVYLRNPFAAISPVASSGGVHGGAIGSQRRTSLLSYPPVQPETSSQSSPSFSTNPASTLSLPTVNQTSSQRRSPQSRPARALGPLSGLVVVINHVKGLIDDEQVLAAGGSETLLASNANGEGLHPTQAIILNELETLLAEEEDLAGLRFVMARTGQSLVF